MRGLVRLAGFALCAVVAVLVPARAGEPNAARLPVFGTVVSIDHSRSTLVLQHAALETMPAGRKPCRLRHAADGKHLRAGMAIQASADTTHQPWVLDQVRVRN